MMEKPKTVLVVEDDQNTALAISLCLKKQGFLVNAAHDGLEALLLAHKLRPDLVLLDMVIPKVSGTLVAKALKEDPRTCQVKIIMISANPNVEGLEGAEHVLIKPFEPNELLDAVNATLNTF
jgi:DNA-binding response OmpR family regulator